MKIYNKIEQGSPEWFRVRKGKVTASHATAIGNYGKGLHTYVKELMSEYFSSGEKENYSNAHTDRGNDLEPVARSMYELEQGVKIEQIGFAEYNEFVGCSPDGIIEPDGMVEIKCPDDKGYFNILLEKENAIASSCLWQIQMNLLILERTWCDLIYYNPNYKKSMTIFRINVDEEKHKALSIGFVKAEEMITELQHEYNKLT